VLFPYIPLTDIKEGRYVTGLSMSDFMALLQDKTIESSKRNSNTLYVNNLSLATYVKNFGGRKERLRELIIDNIRKEQYKYISLSFKGSNVSFNNHSYSNAQIKQWYKVYTEYHKNIDMKKKLKSIGFTEKLLSENYGTDPIDVGFFKAKVSNDPKFKLRHFFNTYLQTKKDYETNFNFYVSYTVVKSIIKKCRKKFK